MGGGGEGAGTTTMTAAAEAVSSMVIVMPVVAARLVARPLASEPPGGLLIELTSASADMVELGMRANVTSPVAVLMSRLTICDASSVGMAIRRLARSAASLSGGFVGDSGLVIAMSMIAPLLRSS